MEQAENDERLNDPGAESVMAAYLQSREDGREISPHEWIGRYPQHASELLSFFENHHWLNPEPLPPSPDLTGQILDDFELLREIARGGMGVVYEAKQLSLPRKVAIKLIAEGILASEEMRMRFRIEAEAAASLSHPNILPIHSISNWRGIDYFVMPLIDGESLQNWVDKRREAFASSQSNLADDHASVTRAIEVVRDLARGVAYAHRRGVIHRDLKPDNVLLQRGHGPLIVDFGLAKFAETQPQISHDGQVLGTPHYMSPEQARGERDVTAATDIYSLGGILLALLTGTTPHQGSSMATVLANILSGECRSLSASWPSGLPRRSCLVDLEQVINRAMATDRRDRYPTSDELADDLQRVLDGEPTKASPDHLVVRVARELSRDQHHDTFVAWGNTLKAIGLTVFVTHLILFLLQEHPIADSVGHLIPRVLMIGCIAWFIHRARRGMWMPRDAAERPVWSIWIGYLVCLSVVNLLALSGRFANEFIFIQASLLSSFAFFAMAGHLWGGSALLGVMFAVITLLSTWFPTVAPLLIGIGWLVAMWILGNRYR